MLREAGGMNGFGGGRMVVVGPDFGLNRPAIGLESDARFGTRLEKLSALASDQLDIPAGKGVVVTLVVNGSPAARAGIQTNDIILEFAGKPVSDNVQDFILTVSDAKGGEAFDVVVVRKGKKETVKGVILPLPRKRGVGFGGNRLPINRRATTSVSVNDGHFTISATRDAVRYTIEGSTEGAKAESIKIVDGETNVDVKSVDKVPEAYRAEVEKLLQETVGR